MLLDDIIRLYNKYKDLLTILCSTGSCVTRRGDGRYHESITVHRRWAAGALSDRWRTGYIPSDF